MAEKLQYQLEISTRATGTGARDVQQEIAALKTQVASLSNELKVGAGANYDLDKALAQTATTTKAAKVSQTELDAQRLLAKRTIEQLRAEEAQHAAQANNAAKSTRNLGGATLALSQGFEDAQYGLRGVLNNIPGLIMMLGGGPGLAGAVSIGAVALSIFAKDLENAQKKAKEATDAGEELTEQLREFFKEVESGNVQKLVDELERLARQQEILDDSTLDAMETEKLRSEGLAKVSQALREAAELEVQLAAARGQITPVEAAAQIAMLQGEAEAASRQAEIALLDHRVAVSEKKYEQRLAVIAQLNEEQAQLEAELERRQAGAAETNRRATTLRQVKGDGELPAPLQRELDQLEAELDGLDEGVKSVITAINEKLAERNAETIDAASIAQEVDNAIAARDIGRETIEEIADISVQGAETALTTAAEEARSRLQEAQASAIASGAQLGADATAALGELERVLSDGAVTATEINRVQAVLERLNTTREQVDSAVLSAMEKLERSANGLLGKVAAQDGRLNRLERQVESLNNR